MYAITDSGYRAISPGEELATGETAADNIPESLLQAIRANDARALRTAILRESDWTQMGDSSLTNSQRASWLSYRQALRDLPSVPGFPDCEWPAAPSLPDGAAGGGIKVPGPSA